MLHKQVLLTTTCSFCCVNNNSTRLVVCRFHSDRYWGRPRIFYGDLPKVAYQDFCRNSKNLLWRGVVEH